MDEEEDETSEEELATKLARTEQSMRAPFRVPLPTLILLVFLLVMVLH
jgi:hypothetical protein